MTACCQALNVTISNDIKESHGFLEGSYTFNGFVSEMDYWVLSTGEYALWYMSSGSDYYWLIGPISSIGTFSGGWMFAVSSELEMKCPINDGHSTWNWYYWDYPNWNPTNNVSIKCLDPNAAGSRAKQNLNQTISKSVEKKQKKMKLDINLNDWKYSRTNVHHDKSMPHAKIDQGLKEMSLNPLATKKLFEQLNRIEYEEKFRSHYLSRKYFSHHAKRSGVYKRSKYSNSLLRKTSTKLQDQTELRNSYKASSKYGLTVILNPNEAEYTDALKNNYIGFKTLVHTPYNFPEVDAVGMAMDKNVQATVGIRGHHSFITDAANALGLYQKKCLSRSDNIKKYKDVKLEVFAYYTKKNCILECHANIFFKKCGCLPYYYPDFSSSWNMTTNCNHTALQCISKLVGKKIFIYKIKFILKRSHNLSFSLTFFASL